MVGFEGLVEMLKRNKEQPSIEQESLEQNQCPFCIWPLKTNEKTYKRVCPICERVFE